MEDGDNVTATVEECLEEHLPLAARAEEVQLLYEGHDGTLDARGALAARRMRRLVLVHGAGGGPEVWVAVAGSCAASTPRPSRCPATATAGPGCDGIPAYAAWLAERLDGPAVVGGASMGGAIALQLALDRPELVEGLVLAGTAARLRVDPALIASLEGDYAAAAHALAARELAVGTHPATSRRARR